MEGGLSPQVSDISTHYVIPNFFLSAIAPPSFCSRRHHLAKTRHKKKVNNPRTTFDILLRLPLRLVRKIADNTKFFSSFSVARVDWQFFSFARMLIFFFLSEWRRRSFSFSSVKCDWSINFFMPCHLRIIAATSEARIYPGKFVKEICAWSVRLNAGKGRAHYIYSRIFVIEVSDERKITAVSLEFDDWNILNCRILLVRNAIILLEANFMEIKKNRGFSKWIAFYSFIFLKELQNFVILINKISLLLVDSIFLEFFKQILLFV